MGMIPVGTALTDGKLINKGRARLNGREADVRDAVHVRRHQDAVPVNGGLHRHSVMDPDTGCVPLFETQGRAGNPPVQGYPLNPLAREVDLFQGDSKVNFYNLCPERRVMGYWADGVFAEYVCVPAERLHRLPGNVDFHEGAL